MQPIFTLPYSEYAVANVLNEKFKDYSIFVPASSQEKGIDLILYNRKAAANRVVTIQVKSSRTYMNQKITKSQPFRYYLWLNRFEVQENADLYFLTGIYPNIPQNFKEVNCNSIKWDSIILVFTNEEMKVFLQNIKLKNSNKPDKMFAFGFNDVNTINLTRGCPTPKPMSEFLLDKKIDMIKSMFV